MVRKQQITLREAAELSGYTSDYIGSLIRSGKITGRKIIGSSAWVTTEEAVLEYAAHNVGGRLQSKKNKALARYQTSSSFSDNEGPSRFFSAAFQAGVVCLIIGALSFSGYLFYLFAVVSNASNEAGVVKSLMEERASLRASNHE
jgi:hypothetical protein